LLTDVGGARERRCRLACLGRCRCGWTGLPCRSRRPGSGRYWRFWPCGRGVRNHKRAGRDHLGWDLLPASPRLQAGRSDDVTPDSELPAPQRLGLSPAQRGFTGRRGYRPMWLVRQLGSAQVRTVAFLTSAQAPGCPPRAYLAKTPRRR